MSYSQYLPSATLIFLQFVVHFGFKQVKMRLLIYGQDGWIGKQICAIAKVAGDEVFPGSRVTVIEDVLADVKKWNPDRVVCALGRTFGSGNNTIDYLEQPDKLPENVGSNLTAPVLIAQATSSIHGEAVPLLYIGSGCIFEYDSTHTIGGSGFTESDCANFFGSSYSVVKGQTDLLMKGFPHVLNARIRMPISEKSDGRDFITKITSYKKIMSIKNSMTILSDWIPFLLALLADGKVGTINAVNPGVIDHETILKLYGHLSKTTLEYQLIPPSEQSTVVLAKRSNNFLMTEKAIDLLRKMNSDTRKKYGVPDVLKPIDARIAEVLASRLTDTGIDTVPEVSPVRSWSEETHKRVVMVTGGAGFVGSNFINYWSKHNPNDAVINFDALLTNSNLCNIEYPNSLNYKFIHGNLLDVNALKRVFKQHHITHIVHFAAASTVDPSFENPSTYVENNIVGTHNLLEAVKSQCGDLQLFMYISTDEVYGEVPIGTCLENRTPFLPTNPYAATKAGAECLLMSYGASFGLPYIITRANNIYGKYQFPTQVIPKFITCLLNNLKLPVHGNGLMSRRFLYVEDYCRGLQTVIERGHVGEVYNIGAEDEIRIIELCKLLVSKLYGTNDYIDHVEFVVDRPHNDCRYSVDSTKIRALGWAPEVVFDTGLEKTIEWYRGAVDHWTKTTPVDAAKTIRSPVFQSDWPASTAQRDSHDGRL